MVDSTALKKLTRELADEFPDFRIIKKTDSRLMSAIDLFLKVITFWKMTEYMTGFITTIGNTVYVPADWHQYPETSRMTVLRHERVHMRQARRYGRLLFSLMYLFLPLPGGAAYFRMKLECEAYEESLAAMVEYYGVDALGPVTKERVLQHFMSAEYFWMWPFRRYLSRWYDRTAARLTDRTLIVRA